tara:strand:+ start:3007 stop:3687 length:681 start_codon:yes stop_codon:yes gene_type:complete
MPVRFFYKHKISEPQNVSHSKWVDYLSEHYNKPGVRVLEVGSRVVTGENFRSKFDKAEYTGFDFHPGKNVDVVGDAHKLSVYFEEESFDLIFSSAVFEHLHMPWVVAEEVHKLLKVNGCVFVETHFSFSSHERPWHFFQFSDMGLRALFNDGLGFDLLDSGMSNPMFGHFSHRSDAYLRYSPIIELYCHSEILCKKRESVGDFTWKDVDIDEVVNGTRYPFINKFD